MINWSIISDIYARFESEASELKTIDEIDALYNKSLAEIQNVKTKKQEAESLAACIASTKEDAKAYLESVKKDLSKANLEEAEKLEKQLILRNKQYQR